MMDELIKKFEDYIEENHENGIWKSYIEIEEITGIDIRDVIKTVYICNKFIENSKGNFTTRKMYKKYSNFWTKLRDAYTFQ